MPGNEAFAEPPDAAIAGENVPLENQYSDLQETMIEDAMKTFSAAEARCTGR